MDTTGPFGDALPGEPTSRPLTGYTRYNSTETILPQGFIRPRKGAERDDAEPENVDHEARVLGCPPLFLLMSAAWLTLKPFDSLANDFVFNLQRFVAMPAQYFVGWGAILFAPFAALITLQWTVYKRRPTAPFRNLAIGLSVPACLFVALNWFNVLRPVTCYNCFFRYGVPLTFYREGRFAGGGGIVWAGLAGDIVAASTIGTSAAWLVARLRGRFRQGN
jgi:hypothetical protein